jgi:hypothetical protein
MISREPDLDFLIDAITLYAQSNEGDRALRGAAIPERMRVKGWIEAACTSARTARRRDGHILRGLVR